MVTTSITSFRRPDFNRNLEKVTSFGQIFLGYPISRQFLEHQTTAAPSFSSLALFSIFILPYRPTPIEKYRKYLFPHWLLAK